jgi:hypothetical protein
MKKALFHVAGIISTIAIISASIPPSIVNAGDGQQPYYGFFPSEKGKNHKHFVHNIFGFSIDIPSTWIFGVNGVPPAAVVFLYPEGLNTGKFSKDYETIEIGHLPIKGISLEDAQEAVMRGMSSKHTSFTLVQKPKRTTLNGLPAITWRYEWPSKTGFSVSEYITLVQSSSGIHSLAVRTTRQDLASRLRFYDEMLATFQPFEPKF